MKEVWLRVLGKEIGARAKRVPSLLGLSLGPRINNSVPASIANPGRAQEMNDSANGSPFADDGVTLRQGP